MKINTMVNLILLILSMLFTQSCLEKDDILPSAIPYRGNQLKMNGYYYQITYDGIIYNSHVMYANGVLITLYGIENTIEEMDEYVRKQSMYKSKYNWGIFFIDDNTIRMHKLGGDYPHKEFVQEGIILNNTTFKITKFSSGSKIREKEEIYHFREFSPKPDSTNVYVK